MFEYVHMRLKANARDRGFALLIVAIALATLSLIFAAALATARQQLAISTSNVQRLQTVAAADGAIATAERDLAAAGVKPPAILSTPQSFTIGDIDVVVSVRRESSKLDLNMTSLDVLRRYFFAAGVSDDAAKQLLAAIGARRKAAEASGTRRRYENHDDQRFQTVSELGDIRGGDGDLLNCVTTDLTVFTAAPLATPEQASPRVRAALGVIADTDIQSPAAAPVASGQAIVSGEIFEITADAKARDATSRVLKQVIVRITGNPAHPVWTLAENTPAIDPKTAQDACDRMHGQKLSMGARNGG
jgi:Tfp pilus assembly protein PilX